MSNIELILGLACVILIWIAHAIHKRAKEDEKSAKSRIDYLSQERDKYRTEAEYKLSLDLMYEKKQHIYEIAEKRHDFVVREYNKLNSELKNIEFDKYEFIKFAGTHNNIFIRILSAPGLWVQRLTTKEPDLKQIEVAIASLKASLPDIYPESTNEATDNTEASTETDNNQTTQENN